MRRPPGLALAALAALAFLLAGAAGVAGADPTAAPAPSASAPPAPLPAAEEAWDAEPLPAAWSERPTLKEWQSAKLVEPTRRGTAARVCSVYRLRDWVKVRCPGRIGAVNQFGGEPQGAYVWVDPTVYGQFRPDHGGEVMFRPAPGDRRVFGFFELVPDMCVGSSSTPLVTVDESWVAGEASPALVLR